MSYGLSTRTTDSSSKPVETGKEYTVDITNNGSKNRGFNNLCKRCAGYKNLKIKINSVKDRFATAKIAVSSTDTT